MLPFWRSKTNDTNTGIGDKDTPVPFSFDRNDDYSYPNLFQEADEMTLVALLMYTMTELRSLAKQDKVSREILNLPITLEQTIELIHDHMETIQEQAQATNHEMTLTALQSIQERFTTQHDNKNEAASSSSSSSTESWWNPFAPRASLACAALYEPARLVAFGDERPGQELVYAVGVDPVRRRVTVAFRGSVTPMDFFTDACIELHRRPNPVNHNKNNNETIGIHHGFDEYLLKRRQSDNTTTTKYDEIMQHVQTLFAQDNRMATYKLYVTGHSLGGALACLFAFEAAAAAARDSLTIPLPVTCVSVASPRVGDSHFQKAFCSLESAGRVRHLRIAHAKDPVTMLPKTSSRKLLATMSPLVWITLKVAEKTKLSASAEIYCHTGVKLRLGVQTSRSKTNDKTASSNTTLESYELSYQGATAADEEEEEMESGQQDDSKLLTKDELDSVTKTSQQTTRKSLLSSLKFDHVPGVSYHFGPVYCQQLAQCQTELAATDLNNVYARLARSGDR